MALTAAFSLTCALVLYLPGNPFMPPGYDGPFKIRFLATVVGLAMMSGYIEHARMRAERALQASERRFRSLIENSASVYAIVGADGTVLYESPSLERVYGYRPEELVGRNILNLVHPDDREGAQAELARLMEQPGQVRTTETRYRHRDGSWRDIEVSGVCLLHDPAVRGVVLTSHDITERKRAERETRQAR
jgi:PAS domain S-box-containing protein